MANETDQPKEKPFDERWVGRMGGGFSRWPAWAQGIFIVWTLFSILFVTVEELHTNIPGWLAWVMVAPYAFILFVVVLPAIFGMWFRWLTWPVRFLAKTSRKG